ncbi:hypothetical protein FRC10_000795 [Ceratobasidium sp. 414]|nr:hypothetical protein FRC10_000795 [Ceratobasidium sp. 414]
MFGIGQYFKDLFGGPPKARMTVKQQSRASNSSSGNFYSAGSVAASTASSIVTVQATNASPANASTAVASGSTATLTPSAPQESNQPNGTVPTRSVLDLQSSLNNFLGLMGRSKGLKHDIESLGDRCKVLNQLLDRLEPEMRSASKFSYGFTKMSQDLDDIIRFLNEFNKKNLLRQAAARKDVRLEIAKLSKNFSDHLNMFMAICQNNNSELQGQKMDEIREKLDALQPIQNRPDSDNADQVEDSELVQHVKDVTGHEPQNSFLLKGQIRYRESVAIDSGHNFDVYKGQMADGEAVAIKLYRNKILNDGKGVKFVERIMRQVEFWTSFQHPSIIPCYGIGMQITRASEGPGTMDRFQFYLVSPFMRNGNAIRQAALGIQYLHDRKPQCVHASMRGENVLIKGDGTACINGFGLTKAPELLGQNCPLLKPSCDIWSWAMTALELISGEAPYYNFKTQWHIPVEITAGRTPNESDYPAFREYSPQPDMMWALLQKCWNMKPEDRPTIHQVIAELDLIEKAQIEAQAEQGHRWT